MPYILANVKRPPGRSSGKEGLFRGGAWWTLNANGRRVWRSKNAAVYNADLSDVLPRTPEEDCHRRSLATVIDTSLRPQTLKFIRSYRNIIGDGVGTRLSGDR